MSSLAAHKMAAKMKAPKVMKLTSSTKPPKASGILGMALVTTRSMGIITPETPTGMASVPHRLEDTRWSFWQESFLNPDKFTSPYLTGLMLTRRGMI
jgi:hypothetical protein